MKIPDIKTSETLTQYAERLSGIVITKKEPELRKRKGQYYTPPAVAKYMASLFQIKANNIRILDPGAGVGILSAAICEQVLEYKQKTSIHIDAFENDKFTIEFLEKILSSCKDKFEDAGHSLDYSINTDDFILNAESNQRRYDLVISNPPYYKINRGTYQSEKLMKIINGQPNIYTYFMASSTMLLDKNGQIVLLTPRSYCSGLYFKKFRKWFFSEIKPQYIHLYHSRKDLFKKDNVLQETIILMGKKSSRSPKHILIGSSNGNGPDKVKLRKTLYSNVIIHLADDTLLRIPESETDELIASELHKFKNTIEDLGFKVSTGPVVPFRAIEFLSNGKKKGTVPLFWMQNIVDGIVKWPVNINKKGNSIIQSKESLGILLPNENYVFIKRFSSKEGKKRINAGVYLRSPFDTNYIGVENHVNYLYKLQGKMTLNESFGLCTLLNSRLYNRYFQITNGNTQVNASELNTLPVPNIETIIAIGKIVRTKKKDSTHPESIILEQLNLTHLIIKP